MTDKSVSSNYKMPPWAVMLLFFSALGFAVFTLASFFKESNRQQIIEEKQACIERGGTIVERHGKWIEGWECHGPKL